MVRER